MHVMGTLTRARIEEFGRRDVHFYVAVCAAEGRRCTDNGETSYSTFIPKHTGVMSFLWRSD